MIDVKALIPIALLLTACGSSPKDTDRGISALDVQLRYAVKNRCRLDLTSVPMQRIGFDRRVDSVAVEICEQYKSGKRTFRDGWPF